MSGPITLAIATARGVAAAISADGIETQASTERQALDGTLACVREALAKAGLGLERVERIAVCVGPGSFTGLRIGVSFARSLAYARGLPMVPVPSYDVVVRPDETLPGPIAAIVEGKRFYYYVRIQEPGGADRFARGDDAEIGRVTSDARRAWLNDVPPGEQALRIARIGRSASVTVDWRGIAVDYGQRPNAVINWEARHGAGERGGAPSAANLERE
jgi:tRNA threonylcarbamoyl adenosine modification protein YeaZ